MNQSNYIPWKGFFDNIARADTFLICDHVQYTRHDWRNRNLIKTSKGTEWLTIPVVAKDHLRKINETIVADKNWQKNHFIKLKNAYLKAANFKQTISWVENLYMTADSTNLSDINTHFLQEICTFLDIKTKFINSKNIEFYGSDRSERIVNACKLLGVTKYITGPAAKNYINEKLFMDENIQLDFVDYNGYAAYPQLNEPFDHRVSILDVILNCGKDAKKYLQYTNR